MCATCICGLLCILLNFGARVWLPRFFFFFFSVPVSWKIWFVKHCRQHFIQLAQCFTCVLPLVCCLLCSPSANNVLLWICVYVVRAQLFITGLFFLRSSLHWSAFHFALGAGGGRVSFETLPPPGRICLLATSPLLSSCAHVYIENVMQGLQART